MSENVRRKKMRKKMRVVREPRERNNMMVQGENRERNEKEEKR